jgi:hypothetical protein
MPYSLRVCVSKDLYGRIPNGSHETWVEVVDRRGSTVRATVTLWSDIKLVAVNDWPYLQQMFDSFIVHTVLFLFVYRLKAEFSPLFLSFFLASLKKIL